MRYVHLYTMRDDPVAIAATAPEHADYWKGLRLPQYLGGPFADRSGGLITFEADDESQARALIAADPFVQQDLLATSLVRSWLPG